MDDEKYTERHVHPSFSSAVEVVAHETKTGGWDVFVVDPEGSCPELESARVDERHLFVE